MNKLTVATFNIDKDRGNFPDRIYHLSNIIYKNRFDILCLQEDFNSVKFSSGKFLNIELDYNYISTSSRKKLRNGILSSSNLTVLSKYDMTLLEELYFNKGKEEERVCQFIRIKYNIYDILLINTYLCPINSRNRREQLNEIIKKIREYTGFNLILFCGDFNAIPSFPEIQKIKKSGFRDKNIEFTHEDKVIIDYIFNKAKFNIDIESKVLLKGFSDHHCLINILKF